MPCTSLLSTALSLFLLARTTIAVAGSSNPLFVLEDSTATFFYDTDAANSRCAGRGGGGDGTLSNVPNCENNGPTIGELNTNRIVALNETLLKGDMNAWCGKEVKIYQEGQEVVFDEPLVVWGTCGACTTEAKFDLSVDAYLKLMPNGDCFSNNGNNPSGFRLEIVDNQIWEPAPGPDIYSPVPGTKLHTGGGYNGPRPTGTVVPPWKDGPVVGVPGVPGAAVSSSSSVSPVVGPSGGNINSASPSTDGQGAEPSQPYVSVDTNLIANSDGSGYNQPSRPVAPATPTTPVAASIATATATASGDGGSGVGGQAYTSTGPGIVNIAINNSNNSGIGGACTKGQRQCVGTELQVCNYISNDASGLQWTTLNQCPGGCDVSKQPDCLQ
ncbi:hypothetical protein I317_03105 [Kwoniella heveanensis CBS 569]|nr:hypothetical protein I317_03105 [Kwoniella heveanensis CBS 569]